MVNTITSFTPYSTKRSSAADRLIGPDDAWDPDSPEDVEAATLSLSTYCLADKDQRHVFLHQLYWIGRQALFAAVSHVWHSLAEPREARCTLMGLLSGTGGAGKTALRLTLERFLGQALAVNNPLPARCNYPTLEAWHQAAMGSFDADARDVDALCARYSSILDGSSPPPVCRRAAASLVTGPWPGAGAGLTVEGSQEPC